MNPERPKWTTLLAESFSYYFSILKMALPLILIFKLPIIVFTETLSEFWLPKDIQSIQQMEASLSPFLNLAIITTLLELLLGTVVSIAIIKALVARREGKNLSSWEALKQARPLWTEGIATLFLMTVILIALTYLLIIPGIIWGIFYAFTLYVVAIEGIGGRAALKRSKALVRGHWWEVFAYVLPVHLGLFLVMVLLISPSVFFAGVTTGILEDQMAMQTSSWQHGTHIFFSTLIGVLGEILFLFSTVFMTLYFLACSNSEKKLPPSQIIE